ncbi:MAG: type II secretion system protein GspN [Myxococcota bacterium]
MKTGLRWLGYISLAIFCFFVFLYWTFPYRRLFDSLSSPFQRRAKVRVQLKELAPYWLSGVSIQNLNLQRRVPKGIAEINIEQLQARVSIIPLLWGTVSSSFSAALARGTLSGYFSRTSGNQIDLHTNIRGVQLGALGPRTSKILKDKQARPLIEKLFVPTFGKVNASLDLSLRPQSAAKGKRKRRISRRGAFDLKKSTGTLKLNIRQLNLGPGYFKAGKLGELGLPRTNLGKLVLKAKMRKGTLEITDGAIFGGDIEVQISGKVELRQPLPYSRFVGLLKVKVQKSFLKNLPKDDVVSRAAFNAIRSRVKKDGYTHYRVIAPFRGRANVRPL